MAGLQLCVECSGHGMVCDCGIGWDAGPAGVADCGCSRMEVAPCIWCHPATHRQAWELYQAAIVAINRRVARGGITGPQLAELFGRHGGLVAFGVDLGGGWPRQKQLLHWAAGAGAADELTMLLQAGALVDSTDKRGCTALHVAAYYGHTAVVEVLLQFGADPGAVNSHGETPAQAAITGGHREIAMRLVPQPAEDDA